MSNVPTAGKTPKLTQWAHKTGFRINLKAPPAEQDGDLTDPAKSKDGTGVKGVANGMKGSVLAATCAYGDEPPYLRKKK